MYANRITVVVRQLDEPYGGEVEELVAFTTSPPEDQINPEEHTEAWRRFALDNGGIRFKIEERRTWIDAGAAGSGVEWVLELMGEGAAGFALGEGLRYMRDRFRPQQSFQELERERFRDSRPEDLRDELLLDAERFLGFRRGDLEAHDFNLMEDSITMRLRRTDGVEYAVSKATDGGTSITRVDTPTQ